MWPAISSKSGALDMFLQKKGAFYLNKAYWTEEPLVHIVPHWNFKGMEGQEIFVPVYIACGGTELDGLDYILATKVFRKFESLNLSLIRDEIRGLIMFMDNLFGKETMKECIAFLQRLQKTY